MENLTRNLNSLKAEFRDKGKAARGYNNIKELLSEGKIDQLNYLLRDHKDEPVYGEELMKRFEVDALIEFYNLLLIASLAGYVSGDFNEELKMEIESILSNPSVEDYYTKRYPYKLAEFTLEYVKSGKKFVENQEIKSINSFNSFLSLNRILKKDKDIEKFLGMLDYVWYNDQTIADVVNTLSSYEKLSNIISSKEKTQVDRAVWGFFKFTAFINQFRILLESIEDNALLQSAIWLFHGYYFDRLNDNLHDLFGKAFYNIETLFSSPELFSKIAVELSGRDVPDDFNEVELKKYAKAAIEQSTNDFSFVINPRWKKPLYEYFKNKRITKIKSTKKVVYLLGQRVSHSKKISQKGRIDNVLARLGGHQFYEVFWDSGSLETVAEHELVPEVLNVSPWELLKRNSLGDFKEYAISTTFHKIRNTTSNTISTLKASRTLFKPYQFKPLVKFLRSDNKRLLIADEVGLGKTIEAGHIMLELAARGELRSALVICTKSLMDKWKIELQEKFNLQLKKYESQTELVNDIKDDISGSGRKVFGIINYEKCRNEKLQSLLLEGNYKFDLLVCDEAHKVRNSKTLQHKGIATFVSFAEAVVFMTATPIMTDIGNLHSLLRLLDKERYDTYDIFYNAIQLNKPFIKAVRRLSLNERLSTIAEDLHNDQVVQELTADREVYKTFGATIGEIFAKDDLYNRARSNMLSQQESVETRIKVQQDLIELNSLNHIYSRTRKKDVLSDKDIVRRDPKTISVALTEGEIEEYEAVIDEYSDENNLGLIQKKRQISSCINAYLSTQAELDKGSYNNSITDSKFNNFMTIIEEVVRKNNRKVIVFAFFKRTLIYLQLRLKEAGIQTEIIHGDIKDRTERIESFKNNELIKVLLSSEVGSEGLDLQFCDALVNYDLPWNPMVVEQRIGRIDRVGQKSPVINIYNLILRGTIEEKIHNRLYERINLFRESIGDMEEILGETESLGEIVSRGIENLYKTKLSEVEQNQQLEQMLKAIETERQNLEKIKSELQDSFANELYFDNEITKITDNNRYVTQQEIKTFVENVLKLKLSTIKIEHLNDETSLIHIPANAKSEIFDFIEEFKTATSHAPELESGYRKFKSKYYGERSIKVTFDQDYAYRFKDFEYLSAYHPFINAITNYFANSGFDKNKAHKLSLNRSFLDKDKFIDVGVYITAVYRISVEKDFGNGKKYEAANLYTTIADINGDDVIILDRDKCDYIAGIAEVYCQQLINDYQLDDDEILEQIRTAMSLDIREHKEKIEEDEMIKFYSSTKRRSEQELNYIENRIERIRSFLREGKGIERILKKELEGLQDKIEQIQKNQKLASINITQSLISVNLLEII